MTFSRAIPLVLALTVLPLRPAAAQQGPSPACQQLLAAREEVQQYGRALQAANQKKASPEELCNLFKVYLRAERTMVKGVEDYQAACGVPAEVVMQVQAGHSKASQIGKQVCEMATPGRRFDAPAPHCSEKTLTLGVPCVD